MLSVLLVCSRTIQSFSHFRMNLYPTSVLLSSPDGKPLLIFHAIYSLRESRIFSVIPIILLRHSLEVCLLLITCIMLLTRGFPIFTILRHACPGMNRRGHVMRVSTTFVRKCFLTRSGMNRWMSELIFVGGDSREYSRMLSRL